MFWWVLVDGFVGFARFGGFAGFYKCFAGF